MLAVLKGIRFMYWPDESSSSSASLLDLENGRLRLFDLIEISAMRPRRRYRRQEPPSQRLHQVAWLYGCRDDADVGDG